MNPLLGGVYNRNEAAFIPISFPLLLLSASFFTEEVIVLSTVCLSVDPTTN